MRTRSALIGVLLLTACAGETATLTPDTRNGPDGDARIVDAVSELAVPTDAQDLAADELSVADDARLEPDVGPDVPARLCAPGEGCFLDECADNADCQSGWCVQHLGQKVCTQSCQQECPPGWSCQQVAGTAPDLVYVCVSDFANLCRPCNTNADCTSTGGAEDACLAYGPDGNFCGSPCGQGCPWGFTCKEIMTVEGTTLQQCVNDTGECPCTASSVELGLTTSCMVANEFGTCAGKRACTADGLSDCDALEPAPESCNGLDDDCDGDVDEPDLVEGDFVNLCNDDNGCTQDKCTGADGCVNVALDSGDCFDGDPCTVADHCVDGTCTGDPVECDDGNPCTDNVCTDTGGCEYPAIGGDCDDQDPCTLGDHCTDGQCQGEAVSCQCQTDADCQGLEDGNQCNGTLICDTLQVPFQCVVDPGTVVDCPAPAGDGAFCLQPSCDPATGACSFVPDHDGLPCNDADACTLNETCADGVCGGGAPLNCNDANPCTDDSCDPDAGCVHADNSLACDDGNVCTQSDTCQAGLCKPGQSIDCDDGNVCTTDTCNPASGCAYELNDSPCNDSNLCTVNDHCQLGECVSGGDLVCDDSNPCTDDTCKPNVGCQFQPNEANCDDGTQCTTGDHCVGGKCTAAGFLSCDDGNICTDDSCDPQLGCVNEPNAAACDDKDACTTVDQCSAGECQGAGTLDCDDGNVCTDDSCDPLKGCLHADNLAKCDDHNACTPFDQCSAGMCQGSGAVDCDDANLCTDDFCDPEAGCVHEPNTLPCNDADPCTLTDVCVAGECVGSGALPCNDGDACTMDTCQPGEGCHYAPIVPCCGNGEVDAGEECDDGNDNNNDVCLNDCTLNPIQRTVPGFSGALGPDLSAGGWSQCAGTASKGTMGKQFYPLCEGYNEIKFACSVDNNESAEYVSPAFSLAGKTLLDGQCDNWNGASNSIYGSDFILSVDSSNPNCGNYNVGYDMYVHFGTQWGCNNVTNTHGSGRMFAYVKN